MVGAIVIAALIAVDRDLGARLHLHIVKIEAAIEMIRIGLVNEHSICVILRRVEACHFA